MGHPSGKRAGTRYAYSRNFREKGMIRLSTYLTHYRVGDIVDIVANAAVQKGLPYKWYHGKTGIVYNVTKSALGIIVHKPVGNRYLEKRVNIRVEHVRHSKCRQSFVQRVKDNAAKKREAKETGTPVFLKRQPVQPRESRLVVVGDNKPETITPIPYETTI